MQEIQLHAVGWIQTDFPAKFGIPRQSGTAAGLKGTIHLYPEYRKEGILRGLEAFSHIWLIWGFSESYDSEWRATVRPPRFGGNTRLGVFATRSPFRPNPLGLSALKILAIRYDEKEGPLIDVEGADMVDGTPVYDIKPYIPYTDAIQNASEGYARKEEIYKLDVSIDDALLNKVPADRQESLLNILKQDPRPAYHHDPERIYGFGYAGKEIRFKVKETTLTVVSIEDSKE